MVSAGDYVDAYLVTADPESSSIPSDLVELVQQRSITLLGIVKLLGNALTSEDEAQRARGVGLLSALLKLLPSTGVNRQEGSLSLNCYALKLTMMNSKDTD